MPKILQAQRCKVRHTLVWMAARKKGSRGKKDVFSVTKAVKANARERVGQPKPERILPDETKTARRALKHKPTLLDLLTKEE
jgi:hypothetical protein